MNKMDIIWGMTKRANGEGTIYHRENGTWNARVTLDGQRISYSARTYKEAQSWVKTTLQQMEQGLTLDATKTTVGQLLDNWMSVKASKLRPATLDQYQNEIRVYLKPYMGQVILKDLSAGRIQAFYARLENDKIGRRTIELCHVVLHGALDFASRLGLIAQNWSDLVEAPRPIKQEMAVWSESQVSQFLAYAPDQAFYRLAFATGMRRGELIGLKWEDLDYRTGTMRIRRQVFQLSGGGFRFQEPKTTRGQRTVRLGAGILEALGQQYNQVLPQMRAIAGERWQEFDLIFPSAVGTPRNGDNVTRIFQELVKQSGLPKIRFHDIRHTAASIMLLHNEPATRVAGILGQSLPVLLSTYAHYIPDDQATAAALMDQVTSPIGIDVSANGWRSVGAGIMAQNRKT